MSCGTKPRIATTCYGMNDGLYQQITDAIAQKYRDNTNKVVEDFTMNGVEVVVGSPGCVDSFTFDANHRFPNTKAEVYNQTLAAERDIAKKIAEEKHLPFADVYQTMYDAMVKAKEKYGQAYPVCGGDGIHPNANGHVLMAYAFLKALGVNGDIGTITVDLPSKKATGSDGHTIKSFDNNTVTIESTKYLSLLPAGCERPQRRFPAWIDARHSCVRSVQRRSRSLPSSSSSGSQRKCEDHLGRAIQAIPRRATGPGIKPGRRVSR